jgi:hypothetical protein
MSMALSGQHGWAVPSRWDGGTALRPDECRACDNLAGAQGQSFCRCSSIRPCRPQAVPLRPTSEGGQFARELFEQLNPLWRRKARLVLPLGLPPLAAWVVAMAVQFPHWRQLMIAVGIGTGLAMAIVLLDSPPEWIDKWRRGWHGERSTANGLRPLESRGCGARS